MKICMPVENNNGLDSDIYGHFGSAPFFYIYDDATKQELVVQNGNIEHEHGACNPIVALRSNKVDAVVCRGMGLRALNGLAASGIKAFKTEARKVSEVVAAFRNGNAVEMDPDHACNEHHCH